MKIKKRLMLFACACVMMFSFVGCGADLNNQTTIYGIDKDYIQKDMQASVQALSGVSKADAEAQAKKYKESSLLQTGEEKTQSVMFQSTFENWADNVETLGKFEDFGDFKVEKAGKTVTCTQQVEFSKRSGQMVYSYTVIGDRMKLKAMSVNVNYTLGETMGKAALNVLMGMAVVFSILILISLIIYAFNIIPYLQKKFSGEDTKEVKKAVETQDTVEELVDDTELIAVIAAAIAASTGASTDDFVVRSIKRRY
ncbi:MAG: OadG family protein [Lachnospiraceae bacterium]|nr:OadG family protein [Lachnospiraceae bacterium]MDY5704930.1 OadG family protein [Lachnospiraceae bacterium]